MSIEVFEAREGPATEQQVELAAVKVRRYRGLADDWEAELARLLATRRRRGSREDRAFGVAWPWGFFARIADLAGLRADTLSKRVGEAGGEDGG